MNFRCETCGRLSDVRLSECPYCDTTFEKYVSPLGDVTLHVLGYLALAGVALLVVWFVC